MDDIDRKIVALLRIDARRSFQDIGGHVSLSAPAVKRRVDKLQSDGVIRSYAAVVDPAAMRLAHTPSSPSTARAACPVARSARPSNRTPEVESAYTVAGEASAILHVRAVDTQHLEEALDASPRHARRPPTHTQVVLSTLFERPAA